MGISFKRHIRFRFKILGYSVNRHLDNFLSCDFGERSSFVPFTKFCLARIRMIQMYEHRTNLSHVSSFANYHGLSVFSCFDSF